MSQRNDPEFKRRSGLFERVSKLGRLQRALVWRIREVVFGIERLSHRKGRRCPSLHLHCHQQRRYFKLQSQNRPYYFEWVLELVTETFHRGQARLDLRRNHPGLVCFMFGVLRMFPYQASHQVTFLEARAAQAQPS
jgi:hypothetical protein